MTTKLAGEVVEIVVGDGPLPKGSTKAFDHYGIRRRSMVLREVVSSGSPLSLSLGTQDGLNEYKTMSDSLTSNYDQKAECPIGFIE